ncbi:MAG: beta-ketoacyl synthase N-terminal-like domain-containing protein [Elainellaceae cyanobacterium]
MQASQKIGAALESLRQELEIIETALVEHIKVGKRRTSLESPKQIINRGLATMQLQQTPIAIVGMASIFPKAATLQEYWENILSEVDCITDVPASHWNVEDYYDPDPRAPDKTYCKRGGFIPDIDFDPMEFGLPPNLLEATDISQLLSLVVAKQTLEDAGYGQGRSLDREHTGVVLGAVSRQLSGPLSARLQYPIWERVLKNSGLSEADTQAIVKKMQAAYVQWEEGSFPGMLSNVIAGRIANRFDFGGINCTIDAACASSLAAFNLGISELVEHRANAMLVGGVDTDNTAFTYLCFSKTPALSRSQQTRPFDAESDGMMLGEGLGMVLVKRLEDAERDRDKIYAVIKGIGTSSDGRYKSIYAPRPAGQVKALRRAYRNAAIAPASVGLIEAHGTGTMAGDPAEFVALTEVFSENNPNKAHIALGSVKSQIGHTKTAAGVASLIKVALALHHKILPPTINIQKPNPKLNIEASPFYLNTKTRPWLSTNDGAPRRAGVSSFGFGGTNYHVVLEEYQSEHHQPYRLHRLPQPILLYAQDTTSLIQHCEAVLQQLQSDRSPSSYEELVAASRSPQIPATFARVGYVAANAAEACGKLQAAIALLKSQRSATWEHPQGIYYRQSGLDLQGKVVALFPGQGSQYVEMGRELTLNFPELRQVYQKMDSLLVQDGLQPVSQVVFPSPVFTESEKETQSQHLQRTEYAQPAIGVLSMGLYQTLRQAGFAPDFVAGHSFGELTALWAAGVLSDGDYRTLVKQRGQAMAIPNTPGVDFGTMLAVKGDAAQVESIVSQFPQVSIANFNSSQQLVLAGAEAEIARVQQVLEQQGHSTVPLSVAAAFHTPLVAHAQKPFAEAVKAIAFRPPQIPVYTNVNGSRYAEDPQSIQRTLKEHLINSVRFKQEIEQIYADGGYCFVEIGPRSVLTNLVKNILGDRPHLAIAVNGSRQKDSDRQLREAMVQLQVAGMALTTVDPYGLEPAASEPQDNKKKKLNVRLNASGYISEKTRRSFEAALQDGHCVKLTAAPLPPVVQNGQHDSGVSAGTETQPVAAFGQPDAKNGVSHQWTQNGSGPESHREFDRKQGVNGRSPAKANISSPGTPSSHGSHPPLMANTLANTNTLPTPPSKASEEQPPAVCQVRQPHSPSHAMSAPLSNHQRLLESVECSLTQFHQHQTSTLQLHQHYLNNQLEYAKVFFNLMQQQNDLLLGQAAGEHPADIKNSVIQSLERNMMRFHDHQVETLRVYGQSVDYQAEYSRHFFQLIQHQHRLMLKETAETPATIEAPVQAQPLAAAFAPVPPAKSASPGPLPETKVDEALPVQPLVQRPEVQEETLDPAAAIASSDSLPVIVNHPGTAEVEAGAIANSIPQIDHPNGTNYPNGATHLPDDREASATPSTSETSITVDFETLSQTLLEVVSDKTGYPPEMLEMEMDLEADLGIDSIKRVEIMGGMMDAFPNLPQPNLEELAELELRTLGQIAEYMQAKLNDHQSHPSGDGGSSAATDHPDASTGPSPDDTPPVSPSIGSGGGGGTPAPESPASDSTVASAIAIDSSNLLVNHTAGWSSNGSTTTKASLNTPVGNTAIAVMERPVAIAPPPLQPTLLNVSQRQSTVSTDALCEAEETAIARAHVQLQPLPAPDWMDLPWPNHHICVVTDDGSQTTGDLVSTLTANGWQTVVLSFPTAVVAKRAVLPDGIQRYILEDCSETCLQQQLEAIATTHGTIAALIHLHPSPTRDHGQPLHFSATETDLVKQVFWLAKHLKESLTQASRQGFSGFFTIARLDGAFGLEPGSRFSPISAGLFGLTKSLNAEWPAVVCRALDLHPQLSPQQAVQAILAEIHDPNRYLTEVAYGSQGRTTLTTELNG